MAQSSGHALAGALLEGGAVGGDGLLEASGAALALTEGRERVAEVVLGRGPGEGHAVAGVLREGGAIGGDGLLEPGGATLARAEGRERDAEVVLGPGPVEGHAVAGGLLKQAAPARDAGLESRVIALVAAVFVPGVGRLPEMRAGRIRIERRDQACRLVIERRRRRKRQAGALDIALLGDQARLLARLLDAGGAQRLALGLDRCRAASRCSRAAS